MPALLYASVGCSWSLQSGRAKVAANIPNSISDAERRVSGSSLSTVDGRPEIDGLRKSRAHEF